MLARAPVRSTEGTAEAGLPVTDSVLSEILESDGEAWRSRFLYRITEGDKVISEEEITGYSFRPSWDVLQRELAAAGFTQTEGAEGLLAWRLA